MTKDERFHILLLHVVIKYQTQTAIQINQKDDRQHVIEGFGRFLVAEATLQLASHFSQSVSHTIQSYYDFISVYLCQ